MPKAAEDRTRTQSQPRPRNWACKSPLAVFVFLAVAAAGAGADLASKQAAFDSMLSDPHLADRVREIQRRDAYSLTAEQVLRRLDLRREALPGLSLTVSTNPGVVFGTAMPRHISVPATVATMALVAAFFAFSDRRARAMQLAMALIMGGAIGNLYDRAWGQVFIPGVDEPIRYQVRDFLQFNTDLYPFVFNIADVLLVVGVMIPIVAWVVHSLRARLAAGRQPGDADK